ncbi:alpha/beta hydrolase [Yoonia maritima]|uniref:alpha/beta hydrolase n=1 Tax=Yoonia maritima TaxID=1435347 RepID=UPI0013A679AA|nr:alpha/beta hydrolase fold domain-containing protein [Yoonia maritima]
MAAPWLFRGPPYICHLTETVNTLTLNWISTGRVHPRRVILYFHGGAYFVGSGAAYRGLLGRVSSMTGLRVCAPDYRLLQDAPFPAAFDDSVLAWDALIAKGYRPQDIILGGDSSGGGLMLALLAFLTQRGDYPLAAFAMSPWVDLTLQGQTLHAKSEVLLPISRIDEVVNRYLKGAVRDDPRASPLFARFDQPPPVLIQVGSGEALRADAERMAGALQGAQLCVWDEVPHVWQMFDGYVPEARNALAEIAEFIQTSFVIDSR